jgi:DNA-binding transcriptional LysR family regulator
LREKAVTDPRAAEILLRWLQRPRQDNPRGVDLDSMSEAQLERLHAGLVKLASLDEPVLAALVEHVLADDELAPSS